MDEKKCIKLNKYGEISTGLLKGVGVKDIWPAKDGKVKITFHFDPYEYNLDHLEHEEYSKYTYSLAEDESTTNIYEDNLIKFAQESIAKIIFDFMLMRVNSEGWMSKLEPLMCFPKKFYTNEKLLKGITEMIQREVKELLNGNSIYSKKDFRPDTLTRMTRAMYEVKAYIINITSATPLELKNSINNLNKIQAKKNKLDDQELSLK